MNRLNELYQDVFTDNYVLSHNDKRNNFNDALKNIVPDGEDQIGELKQIMDKVIADNPEIKEGYTNRLSFSAFLIKDTFLPKEIIEYVIKKHKIKLNSKSGLDKDYFVDYMLGEDTRAVKTKDIPLMTERFMLATELGFKHKVSEKSKGNLYYTLSKRRILSELSLSEIDKYMRCFTENEIYPKDKKGFTYVDSLAKVITNYNRDDKREKMQALLNPFIEAGFIKLPGHVKDHSYAGKMLTDMLNVERKSLQDGEYDKLVENILSLNVSEDNKKAFIGFVVMHLSETPGFVAITGDEIISKINYYINHNLGKDEQKILKSALEEFRNEKIVLIKSIPGFENMTDEEVKNNGSLRVLKETLDNAFVLIDKEALLKSIGEFENKTEQSKKNRI